MSPHMTLDERARRMREQCGLTGIQGSRPLQFLAQAAVLSHYAGQSERCERICRSLEAIVPDDPFSRLQRAELALARGDAPAAAALADEALRCRDNSPQTQWMAMMLRREAALRMDGGGGSQDERRTIRDLADQDRPSAANEGRRQGAERFLTELGRWMTPGSAAIAATPDPNPRERDEQ